LKAETIIEPRQNVSLVAYLKEIWSFRDLFEAFLTRDVKVRYKQTVLGVAWVLIQPLFTAGIFTIIFGRVVKMDSQGLPYMLFYLAALIPWTCFTNALSQASSSLEASAGLLKKVYFPRLISPTSSVVGTVVDFTIGWITFNVIAICWGLSLGSGGIYERATMYWTWLFIPFTFVLLLLQQMTALGIGLVLSVLNAQYRDVRYIIPFLINILFWMSPIVFPVKRLLESRLGDWLSVFIYLNPMAGVIETYRALLSKTYIPWGILGANLVTALCILLIGIWFFRKRENRVIDFL
jgi:lipopolysaccharide transport system permease protein